MPGRPAVLAPAALRRVVTSTSEAHRISYNRRVASERSFSWFQDPATGGIRRGWSRLFGRASDRSCTRSALSCTTSGSPWPQRTWSKRRPGGPLWALVRSDAGDARARCASSNDAPLAEQPRTVPAEHPHTVRTRPLPRSKCLLSTACGGFCERDIAASVKHFGSGWPDLNRRPLDPQSSALTKLRHSPCVLRPSDLDVCLSPSCLEAFSPPRRAPSHCPVPGRVLEDPDPPVRREPFHEGTQVGDPPAYRTDAVRLERRGRAIPRRTDRRRTWRHVGRGRMGRP